MCGCYMCECVGVTCVSVWVWVGIVTNHNYSGKWGALAPASSTIPMYLVHIATSFLAHFGALNMWI